MVKKQKILIIEDTIDFAEELATHFERGGFDTLHSDNINDAVEILLNNKIDGVTLDIQLKGSLGINLLEKIYNESIGLDYKPVIIVVSSFINPEILRILKNYRILHYDKAAPGFNFRMILDSFTSLLSFAPQFQQKVNQVSSDDRLKSLIRHKLEPYDFKVKALAYERLLDGIYFVASVKSEQKQSLASIYEEILGVDYHAAFVGMKRLLRDAFADAEVVPTPTDFIYQIVDEIKKDFPGV